MWNEISKLIDPNFKPAPRGAKGNLRGGRKGKVPYNKKRKFRDEKKSFSKGRSERSSRDGERKSFGYKGKSSFTKKNNSKPTGFTNNPKYFGKKTSESSSTSGEKKSSSFDGKKRFKSRSDRPKSFTFKKHSQKRTKV